MIYFGYVVLNIILAIGLIVFVLRLYRGTPYLYPQFLTVYAYFTVFASLLVLEYGFYITESLNKSYLNGASLFFLVFIFVFFVLLRFFIKLLSLIKFSSFKPEKFSLFKKKISICALLLTHLFLLALFLNLFLSPIPFFSESINRLNFWQHAYLPFLGKILGERSLPIAIILGVLFNFYFLNKNRVFQRIVLLTFTFFIIYLFLLGHKFSPIMMAVFFFSLPVMISSKVSFSLIVKYGLLGGIFLISYVLYEYSKVDSGIVADYGGPLGGVLYRIFVLQGHVFWNMFSMAGTLEDASWQNVLWLFTNKFDGLVLAMHMVSPNLVEGYLLNGVRFTAGFPGFLFGTPFVFSIVFIILLLFIYAIVLIRVGDLVRSASIVRLFIYILLLYFFHFGITMGDFRFLYSLKLFMFLYVLLSVEVSYYAYNSRSS